MPPVYSRISQGVDFLSITDNRFKTARLTVALLLPLDAQTASSNAILPFLLSRSCADYPDLAALQRHLNRLYGARILSDCTRIGNNQALTVTAVSIDDRFSLDRENTVSQCADLLCSMIFNPALQDRCFRESDITREKRCLAELIQSEINEKRLYSRLRCEQILCEGEGYSINRYGTIEGVNSLTAQSVTEAWQRALRGAQVRVVYNASDNAPVCEPLKNGFESITQRSPLSLETGNPNEPHSVREVTERMNVGQAKLVIGFRALAQADVPAMRLMNALLGGTPHSLLFKNVREKLGLCYYCTSSFDRLGHVLLIDSGVDEQNAVRARKEIIAQYQAVCRGEFTEGDIQTARISLENQFRIIEDSQPSLGMWYINQSLDSIASTPSQAAEQLFDVTPERIINAARSVKLGAIYMLAGKGEPHEGK